mgnify:FL=1
MIPNLVTHHVHKERPLPESDAVGYQYVIGSNGIFVRAENRFFSACIPVSRCTIRGLKPVMMQFRLKMNCLNGNLLTAAYRDARRAVNQDGRLNELLYQLRQQPDGRLQMIKPKQRTTPTSISSWPTAADSVICDLHSHGTMPAYFSETDNQDEQGLRLYAVIGNLLRTPEICLRVGVYGYWQSLPVTAVFTHAGPFLDLYKAEAKPS